MQIPAGDVPAQHSQSIECSEAGNQIILTYADGAVVCPGPSLRRLTRRVLLEAARASGVMNAKSGPDAARSADFLHDDPS